MVKFFTNTVISYLEDSINTWISNNHIKVLNYNYSTTVLDDEVLYCVLIAYESVEAKL